MTVNRSGSNDPFYVLAAHVGKKVVISRESVIVERDDSRVWNAAIQLFGNEYIDDSTRGIFPNADPEILEGLRDYPAGHC